jgi:hypothetical protein
VELKERGIKWVFIAVAVSCLCLLLIWGSIQIRNKWNAVRTAKYIQAVESDTKLWLEARNNVRKQFDYVITLYSGGVKVGEWVSPFKSGPKMLDHRWMSFIDGETRESVMICGDIVITKRERELK